MQELADSLTEYTGFSSVWSPRVKVKNLRVDGNRIIVRTNATLGDICWTPENVDDIKKRVCKWVLGDTKCREVDIYTGKYAIDSLITNCGRGVMITSRHKDLQGKHIALWPSHGIYYNKDRDQWIWQRATLWTTVEDLYSMEYVRLIKQMLENSGAEVYMPRADLSHNEEGTSGMPLWTEGARYWLMRRGFPQQLWDLYEGNEYKDDMKCRAMWVNYLAGGSPMNPNEPGKGIPIDLCLAFHTDGLDSGDDSTLIGTLVIYTTTDDDGKKALHNGESRQKVNRNLADWIQTQIVNDLRTTIPNWTRRQLHDANYCESRVPVVPSVLLELLSHKNFADMHYGLDPKFRFTAARSVYKGMLRYLVGKNAVVQPLPIEQLAFSRDGILRWIPKNDPIEKTAKPTYYMVYVQKDDGEWDVQQVDKKTELKLNLKRGVRYNCYVVAGNAGGLSMPSPTVSACISTKDDAPTMLVVDAFDDVYGPEWFSSDNYAGIVPGSYACEDRFTCAYIGEQWDYKRNSQWRDDDNCGWGDSYRDHAGELTVGNTRDYSVLHGRVLQRMGISYVSCTRGMVHIDSTYKAVDIICGRQRQPLDSVYYSQLSRYLDQGGRLLISGDHMSIVDTIFSNRYLHFCAHSGHATRSGKVIAGGNPFTIATQPNNMQLFTPSAECIRPCGAGTTRIAWYADSRCEAAIGYRSPFSNHAQRTLTYAFPLEAANDFGRIYHHSIEWLLSE
ncbi:MAG: N-acetylmuramoyl-L-alanine amidase [Paludibacteraceae bacterium]|nr:N-acetylmuramoyl-L-alanine amidase [Paludibacteraceae bacterium]